VFACTEIGANPEGLSMTAVDTVNLAQKLSTFSSHWDPKVVAELNGQHVKLAKLKGEFVWHSHEHEDELFLVLEGRLEMQLRDRTLTLGPGELVVVPRGVEHCPRAAEEVSVLLFEPAGTLNTGDAGGDLTVPTPERI
jgi:mannose-6-phosphate isomerase-like protein (cupin superfamily)